MLDPLILHDRFFQSRLIMGTSSYPNQSILAQSLVASGTEMVTVAIRRVDTSGHKASLLQLLKGQYHLLPNTAGCYTVKDAILTAELAREALETNWIKLEVVGDEKTLFPDVEHLLPAAAELIRRGFVVLPYCNDDPITCKKLEDMGCAAVMPLAAPIGSGMGIRNPYNLQIIREQCQIPVIIDAGLGTAADAALAMELGADAVLLNSAVARAQKPVQMAEAMKLGVAAGRLSYRSGRIPKKLYAEGSTTLVGLMGT